MITQPMVASGTPEGCIPLLSGSGFAKSIEPKYQSPSVDGTPGFIAYLGALLEEQLIGNPELEILVDGIERRSEIVNPIPHEVSRYGVAFRLWRGPGTALISLMVRLRLKNPGKR